MKKIYLLATSLLAGGLSFGQVSLPFSDSFSYLAGNLHETAPWSVLGTASATGDHILLDGSKVTFDGIGTDAQVAMASQTTGTVYYKIDLTVTSMAGVTDANGGYLAGFTQNGTTFGGTLWAKRVDDNSYNIGIETRTATGVATTYTSTAYATGATNTIVVAYTFNTGTTSDDDVKLWVNPTALDLLNPLLTDTHTGTDLASIASFFLRQDSVAETGFYQIDNLVVANSFLQILSTETQSITGLSVYPNPVKNGVFYITTNANAERNVTVFDVLGKQVLNTTTSDSAINVSNLKTGVYMVQITEEGKTETKKLIIE